MRPRSPTGEAVSTLEQGYAVELGNAQSASQLSQPEFREAILIPTSGITIDTVHRERHPDDLGLKHFGENNAIANNVCQMGHGPFSPGTMHETAKFRRLSETAQQSEKAQKALVDSTTAMAAVACKLKYINAGKGSKLAKYKQILAEAVAGQPAPNEHGLWEDQSARFLSRKVPAYQPGETTYMGL